MARPLAVPPSLTSLITRVATLRAIYLFLLILALGIAVRAAMLLILDVPLGLEFAEIEKIARNLARRGEFADPYKVATGPTAHHAPAYPFLLSLIFKGFGLGAAAGLVMALVNIVLASVQWALVALIARRAQLPAAVGLGAAVLGAAFPYRFLKELRWEAALTGAVTAALILLTLQWWQSPRRTLHSLALGVAWGMGMLCTPNLLPVFLLVLALFVVSSAPGLRAPAAAHVGVAAVGMVLAVTPWTVRNYTALHAFVFVRSNFGLEFSVSNNPQAHILAVENIGSDRTNYFHTHHPYSNRAEAQILAREGEVAYNRRRLRETLVWIRSDPQTFVRLTLGRVVYFWFTPYTSQPWKNVVVTPLSAVAFFGLWVMVRRRLPLGYILLAVWIAYPLVYYLVQTDTRYRYPIEWTFVLLGVFGVYSVVAERSEALRMPMSTSPGQGSSQAA